MRQFAALVSRLALEREQMSCRQRYPVGPAIGQSSRVSSRRTAADPASRRLRVESAPIILHAHSRQKINIATIPPRPAKCAARATPGGAGPPAHQPCAGTRSADNAPEYRSVASVKTLRRGESEWDVPFQNRNARFRALRRRCNTMRPPLRGSSASNFSWIRCPTGITRNHHR